MFLSHLLWLICLIAEVGLWRLTVTVIRDGAIFTAIKILVIFSWDGQVLLKLMCSCRPDIRPVNLSNRTVDVNLVCGVKCVR